MTSFAKDELLLLLVNNVLRRFRQYFSYITTTAHIIHVFPGCHQYEAGALKCLAQGHSMKSPGDPVFLEPRTPGLRVKHSTTEPRRTPKDKLNVAQAIGFVSGKALNFVGKRSKIVIESEKKRPYQYF